MSSHRCRKPTKQFCDRASVPKYGPVEQFTVDGGGALEAERGFVVDDGSLIGFVDEGAEECSSGGAPTVKNIIEC
jgi:hypothetical protein